MKRTHCKKCNKEFTPKQINNHNVYCSRECYGKKPIIKKVCTCQVCGIEFKRLKRDRTGLYCSKSCSCKSMWQKRYEDGYTKQDPMIGKSSDIVYKTCTECYKPFIVGGMGQRQKQCSDICKEKYHRKCWRDKEREYKGYKLYIKECEICKKELKTWKKSQKVHAGLCQERWERIGKNLRMRRYMSKKNGVKDIRIVFVDSVGTCQLCGRKLSLRTKYPHARSCSMDHIIPISCGGVDEYYNLQLACFECNSNKGNGTMPGGEQLKLPMLMAGG